MALTSNTDRDWNKWGKTDPYFGVFSDTKFLSANLNDDSLREFFASGEGHVQRVYENVRAHIRSDFEPKRVLDYGCGVGRLVIPFAARAEVAVGVDVAPAMLDIARDNCEKFGAGNAQLLHVDEMDSLAPASFGLVHSFIVFQHIPVVRGEQILRKLIRLLEAGGVGAIHFTYSSAGRRSRLGRAVSAICQRVGPVRGLRNLTRNIPFSAPAVQMNEYSMNRIFDILLAEGCANLYVEFLDRIAAQGVMLYFQKSPDASS